MEDVIDNALRIRGFSVKTGYYLACASRCAYEEPSDWIEKLGLGNRSTFFTCGQHRGFVAFLEKAAVLAFRGTQNIGNCLTDADTLLVSQAPYPGRVHRGFAEAVELVWPEVRRLLGAPSRTVPLWVTGHSLGGAMATLASIRLTSEGYSVRAVYTYGSPRPGDRLFHNSYSLANYRFVNNNDLIPHLPFRWCYKHVGKLRLVDEEGECSEEQAAWEAKKQSLAGKAKRVQRAHRHSTGLLHALCDFDWLADHHLDKYLDAIKKILPRVPHRRESERLDANMRAAPAHQRRLDSASPAVPPPHRARGSRQNLAISEADFIAAFGNQPQERPQIPGLRRSTAYSRGESGG
ncbi:MAG: lipase family protein [Thermoguttaceae bacterium]|jgi:triacylglycerol lipase